MANILIIEDDPTIRALYSTGLRKRGHVVEEARNSEEGFEKLHIAQPDLIILDILMPGSDGIAFLKTADIPHQYPGTKVIAASNVGTPHQIRELQKLAVDRYILKAEYGPYQLADLVEELIG
jgi:twitching motility two-component system response regulator PilH